MLGVMWMRWRSHGSVAPEPERVDEEEEEELGEIGSVINDEDLI